MASVMELREMLINPQPDLFSLLAAFDERSAFKPLAVLGSQ